MTVSCGHSARKASIHLRHTVGYAMRVEASRSFQRLCCIHGDRISHTNVGMEARARQIGKRSSYTAHMDHTQVDVQKICASMRRISVSVRGRCIVIGRRLRYNLKRRLVPFFSANNERCTQPAPGGVERAPSLPVS